jgi:hypothetical protein
VWGWGGVAGTSLFSGEGDGCAIVVVGVMLGERV